MRSGLHTERRGQVMGYNLAVQWTRRTVLRALGNSALTSFLVPLLDSCAGSSTQQKALSLPALPAIGDLRVWLRGAVGELSQRFPHASALVAIDRRGGVFVDPEEGRASQAVDAALVLTVSNGKTTFEQATSDLGRSGIDRAMWTLRERAAAVPQPFRSSDRRTGNSALAGRCGRNPIRMSAPRDLSTPLDADSDPRSLTPGQWIERVQRLYARTRRVGGNRIVYRSAYAMIEDSDRLYIGTGRDLRQRVVRSRAGVVFTAQQTATHSLSARSDRIPGRVSGPAIVATPVVEVAERSGTMGLEAVEVSQDAIDLAAGRALSIISPIAPPRGNMDLLLEPAVAALIVQRCVGPALAGQSWLSGESRAAALVGQPVASSLVTLVDDPTVSAAFGTYFFDDEGVMAGPSTLIDEGVLRGPIADRHSAAGLGVQPTSNGRRRSPFDSVTAQPSNLVLAPGRAQVAGLIGAIKRGLVLEGGVAATVDLSSWRFSARTARAREVVNGKLTGTLYRGVDLRGDVSELLQAVRGLSSVSQAFSSSEGPAATVTSPYVLTRARVLPAPSGQSG